LSGEGESDELFLYSFPPVKYLVETMDKYSNDIGCIFLIFSNNITRAKQLYKTKIAHHTILWISQGIFNDMCIMSLCDHYILTTGTYGWWGAYLNSNLDKKITMLYPFYNVKAHGAHLNESAKNLYLPGWNVYNMNDTS
jgi:hypothetical protein